MDLTIKTSNDRALINRIPGYNNLKRQNKRKAIELAEIEEKFEKNQNAVKAVVSNINKLIREQSNDFSTGSEQEKTKKSSQELQNDILVKLGPFIHKFVGFKQGIGLIGYNSTGESGSFFYLEENQNKYKKFTEALSNQNIKNLVKKIDKTISILNKDIGKNIAKGFIFVKYYILFVDLVYAFLGKLFLACEQLGLEREKTIVDSFLEIFLNRVKSAENDVNLLNKKIRSKKEELTEEIQEYSKHQPSAQNIKNKSLSRTLSYDDYLEQLKYSYVDMRKYEKEITIIDNLQKLSKVEKNKDTLKEYVKLAVYQAIIDSESNKPSSFRKSLFLLYGLLLEAIRRIPSNSNEEIEKPKSTSNRIKRLSKLIKFSERTNRIKQLQEALNEVIQYFKGKQSQLQEGVLERVERFEQMIADISQESLETLFGDTKDRDAKLLFNQLYLLIAPDKAQIYFVFRNNGNKTKIESDLTELFQKIEKILESENTSSFSKYLRKTRNNKIKERTEIRQQLTNAEKSNRLKARVNQQRLLLTNAEKTKLITLGQNNTTTSSLPNSSHNTRGNKRNLP